MAVDLSFFRSPTSQRLRAEGRAAGEAAGRAAGRVEDGVEKILRLLGKRGVPVSAKDEKRIRSCGDIEVLDRWFDRAITATDISEVFAA
ncbi:hypothetical protein [Nocardia macrotermitis]|uniref:DUF4351 domain-containing protein n=1 Tax=Nocardia macrotermitis TaxID=2585198 RepID=A0A7K0D8T1_9NOCA|nr:hypothetical protein [Nocardia macrotermitis]MQY22137.1 hypothetical protein [Nocardia macrotermitis]